MAIRNEIVINKGQAEFIRKITYTPNPVANLKMDNAQNLADQIWAMFRSSSSYFEVIDTVAKNRAMSNLVQSWKNMWASWEEEFGHAYFGLANPQYISQGGQQSVDFYASLSWDFNLLAGDITSKTGLQTLSMKWAEFPIEYKEYRKYANYTQSQILDDIRNGNFPKLDNTMYITNLSFDGFRDSDIYYLTDENELAEIKRVYYPDWEEMDLFKD